MNTAFVFLGPTLEGFYFYGCSDACGADLQSLFATPILQKQIFILEMAVRFHICFPFLFLNSWIFNVRSDPEEKCWMREMI